MKTESKMDRSFRRFRYFLYVWAPITIVWATGVLIFTVRLIGEADAGRQTWTWPVVWGVILVMAFFSARQAVTLAMKAWLDARADDDDADDDAVHNSDIDR